LALRGSETLLVTSKIFVLTLENVTCGNGIGGGNVCRVVKQYLKTITYDNRVRSKLDGVGYACSTIVKWIDVGIFDAQRDVCTT
jgi:hypothetical protein